MKTNHTPEPWRVEEERVCGLLAWGIRTYDDNLVICGEGSMSPEDARRIVACVNACKGFTTEELIRIAANKGDPQAMLKAVEEHLKEKGNP